MKQTFVLTPMIVCLVIGMLTAASHAAGETRLGPFKGLPLAAALTRLQQHGLRLVFSSDLVRPDMTVTEEPRGRWPHEILDDLLAPHALASKSGPAGTLLVVRKAPAVAPTGMTEGTGRAAGRKRPVAGEPRPRPTHAEDIVVRPMQPFPRKGEPTVRETLTREAIQASPDFGNDPVLPVSRLTGIAPGAGAGGLHVRGGTRREAKIVLDGLELYEPYHLRDRGGPISIIDSRTVGEIGVLNGAFPAEYGGHMGAVLEMDTIVPSRGFGGDVGVSIDDQRLAAEGTSGDRVRWLVAGRRGAPSQLLDALEADPNYHPTYWDAYAKADYRIEDRSTLSVHVLASGDEVEGDEVESGGIDETIVTVEDRGTFRSGHANGYAWITFGHALTPALYARTVLSHGRLTSTRFGSAPLVSQVDDNRSVDTLGIKQDWLRQSSRHFVKWGFDVKRLRASYAYGSTPAPRTLELLDPSMVAAPPSSIAVTTAPAGSDIGLYVADRFRLHPRLNLEVGLRWDLQTYVPGQEGSLGPRVNAVYALGERTSLRLGWGYFSQPQKIHELQVEDGVSTFLPAERAEHRVVSLAHVLPRGLQAQVSAYQKLVTEVNPRFENLFDPLGFFPEADGDRVRIAPASARAEGLEVVIKSPASRKIGWWAGYALARTEDEIDGRWVPRSWDQRHALSTGLNWKPRDHWDVTFAGAVHSGRPTTPVTAVMSELTDGASIIEPIVGARNSERLPAYSRFDLRVSRQLQIGRSTLRASVTVTDVLDRENVCCVTGFGFVPQPDGSVTVDRLLRQDLSRLITFGLAWRF